MSNRTLLIVRTHRASEAALEAFDRYAAVPGIDVTFVCDEREEVLDMGGRAKLSLTEDRLTELGLYLHPHSGWRCGDYFYYVARAERPDYDHYWMIEPDVYLNMTALPDFFDFWAEQQADLLAIKFGPRASNWGWYGTVKDKVAAVHGMVFSISRLSAAGADALLEQRRADSRDLAEDAVDTWPNDEAFTANTMIAQGRSVLDFNGAGREFYTFDTFRNGAPYDRATLIEAAPDDRIYHPARVLDFWLERSHRMVRGIREIKSRSQVSSLTRHGFALMETEDRADEALVTLMQARHGWMKGGWADFTLSNEQDQRKSTKVQRMIAREFGANKARGKLGTVHYGKSKINGRTVRTVQPDDFVLEEGIKVGRIPANLALPYCWDPDAGEVIYTLHTDPAPAMRQPFLYGGQRMTARVVARLKLERLDDLFGPPDPQAELIFIFSIGRTGSTLLQTLMEQAVPRSFSEPDMLTQLANNRRKWRDDKKLRARLLWHAVSAFFKTAIEGVPEGGPVAVKLRSQVNGMAADLTAMFPAATFVFMTRERTAWARSTRRVFGMEPQRAALRLLQGVKTVEVLKETAKSLVLLRYEDVLADPVAAVERIVGHPVSDAVREGIAATMTRDSQEGTNVGRAREGASAEEEAAWMTAFEAEWARLRPGKLIEKLGLDL